jgi:parallel beta-helix repeat protein
VWWLLKSLSFSKRITAAKTSLRSFPKVWIGVFIVAMVLAKWVIPNSPSDAAVGINNTINYQGRLLNASGAVVADGNYNMRFKIYKDGDGTLAGDTAGAPAGTLLWTEKRENFNSQGVVVKNGYFSVSLNTICPFTGGSCQGTTNTAIDFNLDTLFLSADIGGTSVGATPTYDGEMLPMKRLAASPYALNSGKVGGIAATQFVRNDQGNTLTGTQIFQNAATNAIFTINAATNQIELGKPSTLAGKIVINNATNANTVSLTVGATAASYGLTLPLTAPALSQCLQNDGSTIGQLTFAACGVTGANFSLSNLASVAINTSLLPGVTNSIDAGSSSFTFKSGYFGTSALTPLLDTITAGALNIGTNTATSISLKQDTNIAAGKSLTITGSGTRPGSPTAGQLYFDTTTNQMIQFNGTKWVSDHSSTTKIVAASNSTQAIKDAADLVLTGTADQTNLNTLLAANPGGSIYLAEGTYSVSGAISIPNNTTLFGAGAGTLITIPNAQNGSYNLITNTDTVTGTHVQIHDLLIDGNKANQTSGTMNGINLNGIGGSSGSTARDGAKVYNVTIRSLYGPNAAIGLYISNSRNTNLSGITSQGNGGYGIYVGGSYNTLTGSIAQGNGLMGIAVSGSYNTITGNLADADGSYGFSITNNYYNTLTGNTATGNSYGIYLQNTNNNVVSSNSAFGSSVFNLYIYGSTNNTFTGNKLDDSGGATTNNGIFIGNSSIANTISGNDITDTSCTSDCYAINIGDAGSISNYLADNRHSGSATNQSSIRDISQNTTYANQPDGGGHLINKSQGGGFAIGASTASSSLTLQGGLNSIALPAPALSATVTNVGTAGATTYRYQITALDGTGESTGSTIQQTTTGNATLSGVNYNTITWTPVGGAVNYKIYRCTGAACTPALLTSVAGINSSYKDTAAGAPSGAVPVTNTTGGAIIQGGSGLTLGLASTATGKIVLANSTNANTVSINSGTTSATYNLTLPNAAPALSQCLQNDGTTIGQLIFSSCGTTYTVSAVDTVANSGNGLGISGTNIFLQSASGTQSGAVNIAAQAFAGTKTFNGGLVVAASQSIVLTGSGTRPGSPTAGQLYYDTTTNQMLQYNGTKWVSDHSTSTVIVAASNSSQTLKDSADYIATGTADQGIINTALTAATGGSIYLAEGTYTVSAAITIPNSTTLFGAGAGSLITIPNAQNLTYNIIQNTDQVTGTRVTIHDLRIDGNKANQTAGVMNGIYLKNMGGGSGSSARDGAKVTNVTARAMYGSDGIDLVSSNNNTLHGNTFQGNGGDGIWLSVASSYNSITGNNTQGNAATGIELTASTNNSITGNTSQGNTLQGFRLLSSSNNNTLTGNTSSGNSDSGIVIQTSTNNTITGNTSQGNTFEGIRLVTTANNNTVTGNNVISNADAGILIQTSNNNTVTGNNLQNDSNGGIYLITSNYTIVSGNKAYDNGTSTENRGVMLQTNSTSNSIIGNDITDSSCTSTCYAINITDAGSISNYLSDNHHSGTTANSSSINDAAPNTVYANQSDGSGNLINKGQGGGFTVGASTANSSLTLQGGLTSAALPVPTLSATVTNVGTAGATTYRYQITALDGTGETTGSAIQQTTTGNATLSGANYNTITWTPVGGAVNYKIYRCTGAACTPALLTTLTGLNTSYNDIAVGAPSGAVPVVNTTGGFTLAGNNSTYLQKSVSATAFLIQNASSENSLVFDGSTKTLKVYDVAAGPTAFASISYSGGVAKFAASVGTTQIGNGTGNVTSNLTGAADYFLFGKTYTPVAAYSLTDFTISRTLTGAANALTGTVLSVLDNSSGTVASPTVLYVNQNNASATGKLILAQTTGSTTRFSVDTTGNAYLSNRLGINTTSPLAPIHVVAQDNYARIYLDTYGNLVKESSITGYRAGGTIAAPTATISGSVLLGLRSGGYGTTGFGNTAASILMTAAEGYTDTAQGSKIDFYTNPIGTTTPSNPLSLSGDSATLGTSSTTGTTILQSGNTLETISNTGHNLQTFSNSSAALQVINSAGLPVFTSDTLNNNVVIGSATTDNTQITFQLDSFNTFADTATCTTTTNQGAMYYNTVTNAIRTCVNGNWEEAVTTEQLGLIVLGVVEDSGSNPGDIGSITTAAQTGPCKVSWFSTTSVKVAPCVAYSGGRKVVVPSPVTITGLSGVSTTYHICFNGTNNAPAIGGSNIVETTAVPTFSATAPVLCIADVKTGATGVLANIYDTRVFVSTLKQFATANVATTAGMIVTLDGVNANRVITTLTANSANVRGVIVVGNSTASTTSPNVIIATRGPAWVKSTIVGTVGQTAQTSGTTGYALTAAAASLYKDLGLVIAPGIATCTAATNCQFSILVDVGPH